MATYCFKCPRCSERLETNRREPEPVCINNTHLSGETMVRDYSSEGVQLGAGTRPSRTDDALARKQRLILPDAEEFKAPDDPDGTKGLREWRDNFQPGPDTPDVVGNSLPKSHF